jgi:hypothetical protein
VVRGLIIPQYALRGRNYSTLKFLITKVEDINAYEDNSIGEQMFVLSLHKSLPLIFSLLRMSKNHQFLTRS